MPFFDQYLPYHELPYHGIELIHLMFQLMFQILITVSFECGIRLDIKVDDSPSEFINTGSHTFQFI